MLAIDSLPQSKVPEPAQALPVDPGVEDPVLVPLDEPEPLDPEPEPLELDDPEPLEPPGLTTGAGGSSTRPPHPLMTTIKNTIEKQRMTPK